MTSKLYGTGAKMGVLGLVNPGASMRDRLDAENSHIMAASDSSRHVQPSSNVKVVAPPRTMIGGDAVS